MKYVKNKFGEGNLYSQEDFNGKIYEKDIVYDK